MVGTEPTRVALAKGEVDDRGFFLNRSEPKPKAEPVKTPTIKDPSQKPAKPDDMSQRPAIDLTPIAPRRKPANVDLTPLMPKAARDAPKAKETRKEADKPPPKAVNPERKPKRKPPPDPEYDDDGDEP